MEDAKTELTKEKLDKARIKMLKNSNCLLCINNLLKDLIIIK